MSEIPAGTPLPPQLHETRRNVHARCGKPREGPDSVRQQVEEKVVRILVAGVALVEGSTVHGPPKPEGAVGVLGDHLSRARPLASLQQVVDLLGQGDDVGAFGDVLVHRSIPSGCYGGLIN